MSGSPAGRARAAAVPDRGGLSTGGSAGPRVRPGSGAISGAAPTKSTRESRPTFGRVVVHALSARDPASARWWAATLLVVVMLATLLVQGILSHDGTTPVRLAAGALVLTIALGVARLPARWLAGWFVLLPLVGTAVIVYLDLASGDAGVTGQAFFVIPVIWAAVHLRAAAVGLASLAAIAGEAVVVFTLRPEGAVASFAYISVLVVVVAVVLTRVVAKHEKLVGHLRTLSESDALTGLATRRVLNRAVTDIVRGSSPRAALVLLDLDRFKAINDTYGHGAGDAALTHVAAVLAAGAREGDVVARLGGDELAVLLVACSAEDAGRRAQELVESVRRSPLYLVDGSIISLSVSAGVATVGPGGDDVYERADAALYGAKRSGRGRAVLSPLT